MGINVHEFKDIVEKAKVVIMAVNDGNYYFTNEKSMRGFQAAATSLDDALETGTLPGWLAWKLIKSNINPHFNAIMY